MNLTIPKPLDMHVHLREGDLLRMTVPRTARYFSKALIMPNLTLPIRTAKDVSLYRQEIMVAASPSSDFEPLMTFKILPDTDPSTLKGLKGAGAVAGKVYPKGLTTNAEDGVEDYFALHPVFTEMQKLGLVLCLHGEKPGKNIDGLNREHAFLRTLFYLARTFPKLRIVLEHITTAAAVDAVLHLPDTVAATITVHHLLLTHDDVGGDHMQPHHYCKPVAKFASDRDALVEAAVSGCPKFFFGSDSAPHLRGRKECSECCAGIFTAPIALPLLASVFKQNGALDRLRMFAHDAALRFYGLYEKPPPHAVTIMLKDEPIRVPEEIGGVVPFCAGQWLAWSVETS